MIFRWVSRPRPILSMTTLLSIKNVVNMFSSSGILFHVKQQLEVYIAKIFSMFWCFSVWLSKWPAMGFSRLPVERRAVKHGVFQALSTALSFNDSCPVVGLMGRNTVLLIPLWVVGTRFWILHCDLGEYTESMHHKHIHMSHRLLKIKWVLNTYG